MASDLLKPMICGCSRGGWKVYDTRSVRHIFLDRDHGGREVATKVANAFYDKEMAMYKESYK